MYTDSNDLFVLLTKVIVILFAINWIKGFRIYYLKPLI
jgi:hypothetical protein